MVYDVRGNDWIAPDPILTNIAVGYMADADLYIAEQVLPTVRVTKQAGQYPIFGLEAWQLPFQGDLRAPGTRANEIPGLTLSKDTFYAYEHALEVPVTPEEREMAQGTPLDPFRDGTQQLVNKILLGREVAARDMIQNPANYAAGNTVTLAGATQWNDDTSDPIGVFRTAQQAIHSKLFRPANTAIIPYEVMWELQDHPDILARMSDASDQIVNPQLIADLIGVEKVLVPGTGFISSENPIIRQPTPEDVSYLWGKDVWLGWVPPRPGWKQPAFGYTFVNPIGGQIMPTDRRRDSDHITDYVRTRHRYDQKLVAKDANDDTYAGYLIQDAVA